MTVEIDVISLEGSLETYQLLKCVLVLGVKTCTQRSLLESYMYD